MQTIKLRGRTHPDCGRHQPIGLQSGQIEKLRRRKRPALEKLHFWGVRYFGLLPSPVDPQLRFLSLQQDSQQQSLGTVGPIRGLELTSRSLLFYGVSLEGLLAP